MREIYRPLYLNKAPLLFTCRRTAELIKYAANAFLATKITFINEIADLCEAVGADVQDVARGIGLDNRIGAKFLHAGPGYGGSCFPKDTLALLKTAEDARAPLRIVEAVVKVNDARKRAMGRKVVEALGGEPRGKTVALLGLTFKPNTDDMRERPPVADLAGARGCGVEVRGYDPEGMEQARPMMPGVALCAGPYEAAAGADAVVLVTEWDASAGARPRPARRRRCAATCWSTSATSTNATRRSRQGCPMSGSDAGRTGHLRQVWAARAGRRRTQDCLSARCFRQISRHWRTLRGRLLDIGIGIDVALDRPRVLGLAFELPSALDSHRVRPARLATRAIALERLVERRTQPKHDPRPRKTAEHRPFPLHQPALERRPRAADRGIVEGAAVETGRVGRRAAVRNHDRSRRDRAHGSHEQPLAVVSDEQLADDEQV